MRCPICLKERCDRHSQHQQEESLRGAPWNGPLYHALNPGDEAKLRQWIGDELAKEGEQ